jgi:hypothetical protein
MTKFNIGDVVKHNYSTHEQGTITDIRDDPYSLYVKWDSRPERNDWYKPEALVLARGGQYPVTLKNVGYGKPRTGPTPL